MSTAGKKKMNEIVIKKTAPVRLIKCYVCNKHLSNQSEFNQHLEEHQSKLNRTSVEEIQRKTQESFRSKRQPSALMRTCSSKREEKKEEDKSSEKENLKEDVVEDEEQREVEDALRESQIMLERMEFLTQIADTPAQKSIVPVIAEEDIEE
jgi:leucyl aminopeptidase